MALTPLPLFARWLMLVNSPGFGPVKLAQAAGYFSKSALRENAGSAQNRLSARDHARIEYCLYAPLNPDPETRAHLELIQNWLNVSQRNSVLALTDDDYPQLLAELPDPPPVLYLSGDPSLLHLPQLAMVGSRKASRQGQHIATALARDLNRHGFIVTSGLALGIDTAAHRGCEQFRTIAVLGCGCDRFYPPSNSRLQQSIAESGLLVSEFLPGTVAAPHHFPKRNRIIAGLSLGTLVVEASVRSGSLHTAQAALDIGREVMAIPGSIYSTEARGCHHLIKQGAALIESAADIVERLAPALIRLGEASGMSSLSNSCDQPEQSHSTGQAARADRFSPVEELLDLATDEPHQQVLKALSSAKDLDELVNETGLDTSELLATLLALELDDRVIQEAGRYQRHDFALK